MWGLNRLISQAGKEVKWGSLYTDNYIWYNSLERKESNLKIVRREPSGCQRAPLCSKSCPSEISTTSASHDIWDCPILSPVSFTCLVSFCQVTGQLFCNWGQLTIFSFQLSTLSSWRISSCEKLYIESTNH